MWTYTQRTGALEHDGAPVAIGYSGAGEDKNDPGAQALHNRGPIPCGLYDIGLPHDTASHGPFVLGLTPHEDNEMFGRSAFLIHGDSVAHPGTASQGCIIVGRAVRERVAASGDHRLTVVAG